MIYMYIRHNSGEGSVSLETEAKESYSLRLFTF